MFILTLMYDIFYFISILVNFNQFFSFKSSLPFQIFSLWKGICMSFAIIFFSFRILVILNLFLKSFITINSEWEEYSLWNNRIIYDERNSRVAILYLDLGYNVIFKLKDVYCIYVNCIHETFDFRNVLVQSILFLKFKSS